MVICPDAGNCQFQFATHSLINLFIVDFQHRIITKKKKKTISKDTTNFVACFM